MSYPFLVTLADLDGSLQAAEAQIELLAAGLEIHEEHAAESLKAACHHAALLASLIHAERPNAEWNDRKGLDDIVLDLEAEAEARRDQQRRARVLELADELDAGRVQHRFQPRTALLNGLRVDASRELPAQAALTENAKELPGPAIREWLAWAFDLEDDKDAAVLAHLRADFIAVERFTGEMEESYWLPGGRNGGNVPPPPGPATPPNSADKFSTGSDAGPSRGRPAVSDNVKPQGGGTAVPYVNHAETDAWTQERATIPLSVPAKPPGEPSALWQRDAAAEAVAVDVAETENVPLTPSVQPCAKCGHTFSGDTHSCPEAELPSPAAQAIAETARAASAPLQAAAVEVEKHVPEISSHQTAAATVSSEAVAALPAEAAPEDLAQHTEDLPATGSGTAAGNLLAAMRGIVEKVAPYKNSPATWAGAAGFVVLSVLFFAIIYHVHARPGGKSNPTVEAASANAASDVAVSDATPESATAGSATNSKPSATPADPKSKGLLLHRQPAEGPQDSILLSIENCGRAPGNVECWGYVSNVGGANSRVSLDRVDVVDSRGNSFSLDRNGQFAFPGGHSSEIAPGSRVKFTVKVPDKDAEARTLTLYMDLSNPRSLEYTFRDVPVAE